MTRKERMSKLCRDIDEGLLEQSKAQRKVRAALLHLWALIDDDHYADEAVKDSLRKYG